VTGGALTLAAACLAVSAVGAQHGPETFTATATATRGDASAAAPITITIERYSSADDRTAILDALRTRGTIGARQALAALSDAGVIEVGGRRTAIKFAVARPTASGRLVTILTAEPLFFLGAGLPAATPREGYEVAAAILDARDDGAGIGELSPAAKVGVDAAGAVLIEDYGTTVVWLQGLIRAR
jgi:hypothetical protein